MEKLEPTVENIRTVLKEVRDPEIPANIVALGLIYDIQINEDTVVAVVMTLTTAGCPMVSEFMESVRDKIMEKIKGVRLVNVDITFDPPWNPSMISEEALFELGITAGAEEA